MIVRYCQTLAACLVLLLSLLTQTTLAACYYPNGDLALNDAPCNYDLDHSSCCPHGYVCLSNKVCQATGVELQKDDAAELVRGSCTDQDWRSSECPSFCIDPDHDDISGPGEMGKCGGTNKDLYWCLNGDHRRDDCANEDGILYFAGAPSVINAVGITPTTSAQTPSSQLRRATKTEEASTKTPESESSKHTNSEYHTDIKPPIIGAVVSGAVILLFVGVVGGGLYLRSRRNIKSAQLQDLEAPSREVESQFHVLQEASYSRESQEPTQQAPSSAALSTTWYPHPLQFGPPFNTSSVSLLPEPPADDHRTC